MYRDWSEYYPCQYQVQDKPQQKHIGTNVKKNVKNNFAKEQDLENVELFSNNCGTTKKSFNSEIYSEEISSDTLHKDSSKVSYQVPNNNHPKDTVINRSDLTKSAENETHGSTKLVYSFQHKILDLVTLLNIQGNVGKKNKLEEIYDATHNDGSELLFCPQSDKSDRSDRTDSGCMSHLQQGFQSQTTTNSGIAKDQHNENEECNANGTVSAASVEAELQVKVKDAKSEHSQDFRVYQHHEKSCADDSKIKTLHDKLFEVSYLFLFMHLYCLGKNVSNIYIKCIHAREHELGTVDVRELSTIAEEACTVE